MNAFVTGGSRGIGRAIVLKFVKEGWNCAFTYRSNKKEAEETIKLAKEINKNAILKAYQMDVKEAEQVEKTVDEVLNDFEDIEAIVNNAAMLRNNAAALMSIEEWKDVIDADLSGPFYVISNFLMHFISNRNGKIINISSLAQYGSSGQVNYAAAKAGLEGMTLTLAKEYGPKGIRTNMVTVGYVETDMTNDHMAEHVRGFWMQHCPLKRVSTGEDIAKVVYFLACEESSFVNGETINAAGGLTYAP